MLSYENDKQFIYMIAKIYKCYEYSKRFVRFIIYLFLKKE